MFFFIRVRVLRNNYKLRKRKEKELLKHAHAKGTEPSSSRKSNRNKNHTNDADNLLGQENLPLLQDQGYVRPRVLILCPFRSSARKIVSQIISLLGPNTTVSSMSKFEEEYGNHHEDANDDDDMEQLEGGKAAHRPQPKPLDYRNLFHDNIDDDFKMGIQINPGQGKGSGNEKGAYVRLFSDFYVSDIIIASPIGLKLVVENSQNNSLNFDFLSSIEILMIDQADVLYMQNWEHVQYIVSRTNQLPKSDHDTDFSRVRPYFLDVHESVQHRQLLISSYFTEPEMQSFFRQYAHSHSGSIKLKKMWNNNQGYIANVNMNVKQVFQKLTVSSVQSQEDERFKYFCNNILVQLIKYDQTRTVIVTPSYFHYVRVRNELMRREVGRQS